MNKKNILASTALLVLVALTASGCTKKTTTNTTTNTVKNTNVIVTEAPYIMTGSTKVFNLKLVNGLLNYKTMTFHAGDTVEVRLTSDSQPVDFQFQEVSSATSVNGVFGTVITEDDRGGTYHLICKNTSCGNIAVTVIPNANINSSASNTNASANINAAANTNTANQITKVELQRIPAGTTFSPTNTYETTTSFQVGDQFGLGVTGNFAAGTKLAHSFTDSSGAEIEAQSQHPDIQNGTNGSCCFGLPATAGSYDLKLYVNGTVAQSIPFTMQ
ncbi:MAG: hypothetical protein WCV50_06070 [Patescibacteria group bacterium]|jgi:hypothetical protein